MTFHSCPHDGCRSPLRGFEHLLQAERLVLRVFAIKESALRNQIAFAGYVKDFVRGNGGELDVS